MRGPLGGFDQRREPIRNGADGRERLTARAAMSGQVRGENAAAVMREPARQQRPDGVIKPGAVHEDDERQRGIEFASARADKGLHSVDDEVHHALCETRNA